MKRPYLNGTWYPGAPLAIAPSKRRSLRSGVALIVVLAMLALISILLMAFMASTTVELRASKSYAVGLNSRSLADSAANFVIAQIQDATFLTNSSQNYAWASQPGMIRTYDSSGNLVTAYKLYSSDTMRTNSFNPVNLADIPAAWASSPDQYVDLNKPVIVSGYYHYPIIDPSAVATAYGSTSAADGSTNTPIQGCYLTNAATATTGTSNPVPMPVQWMYILKDGTFATITSSGSLTSTSTGSPVVSSNPIVGRVAFWTDDESCKVNINTSGEGTFWDRPMAESPSTTTGYERGFLSGSIPAQNEFQRYPGHPAMTSLSVIFPPVNGETTAAYNERVYGIIPRLATGGSQSGTVAVSTNTVIPVPNVNHLFDTVDEFLFSAAGTTPRTVNLKGPGTNFTESDVERVRFFLTANSRAPEVNMFNKPRVTLWPLQANTANVSDPVDATNRTAKDKLIALCSTIGNTPYYFQRYNTYTTPVRSSGTTYPASLTQNPVPSSQSTSSDWSNVPRNQSLYLYLQTMASTAIPGLGGSLGGAGGKYPASVRDQILTEMWDFLRSDVTTATTGGTPQYWYAPGTTGSTTVTGERQVVPLELPANATALSTTAITKGFGRFETIQQAALVFYRMDKATVTGSSTVNWVVTQNPPFPNATTTMSYNMGVVLLLNPFNPTPGSRPWCENMRIQVTGLNGMKINHAALTSPFPATATLLLTGLNDTVNASALMGPEYFFRYFNPTGTANTYKSLGTTSVGSSTEEQFYPFYASTTVSVAPNVSSFKFTPPTSITIAIDTGYSTSFNSANPVQTMTLTFPSTEISLPIPTVSSSINNAASPKTESDENTFTDFNARIGDNNGYPQEGIDNDTNPSPQHNPSPFICSGDVVRSLEARYKGPAMGDLRVFAGLAKVPTDYFEAHGMIDSPPADGIAYNSSTQQFVHSMRMFNNPNGTANNFGAYTGCGSPQGVLVAPAYYQVGAGKHSLYPIVPRGLTAGQVVLTGQDGALHPGDWDTGPGNQPDGPYINKPDETSAYDYSGFYTQGSSQYTLLYPDDQGITYSPNRQISSAVAFGSLPTGIDPANPDTAGTQLVAGIKPWQTLLFCANPASEAGNAGTPRHPGFGSHSGTATLSPPYTIPPDHAFLDFFTMPIVEPYAISEPFSTAGKVNMNYQIVPFTYLNRDTAVRAVLKSDRMMAIPVSAATGASNCYKIASTSPSDYRYTINPDELTGTLAGFQQRFSNGDIFRSASEICSLSLVPQYPVSYVAGTGESISSTGTGAAYSTMNTWWSNYTLTGDNVREAPYGFIYPRLTTKSNTYTVHVWAQMLQKATGTSASQFVDGKDQVTSEYRGSYVIQRYLDPDSDSLISLDGSTPSETNPLSVVGPYKFRILSSKRFAP